MKLVTSSWYLGGFLGTDAEQAQWLAEKVEGLRYLVDFMFRVA